MTHSCGLQCLGPLTFHSKAVGDNIHLSEGYRRAERTENTFRGGVVFSSRPVRTCEKVRVLVEKHVANWSGAMRVGFTNVPPFTRSLPLPLMAMPNLTKTPGHWAIPVSESSCQEGSLLEFWVSDRGHINYRNNNGRKQKLQVEVDLKNPLWAMIDVYGQTCSIFLLGSEKKDLLFKKTSCPAPEPFIRPPTNLNPDYTALSENSDCVSCLRMEISIDNRCVVCMVQKADITLPCGHRCLCHHCTSKVLVQFGFCPLCRLEIDSEVTFEGSMSSKTRDS
ncbi:E3 ubiquitin-protein ligase NEURL3-like [Anableps anableps]